MLVSKAMHFLNPQKGEKNVSANFPAKDFEFSDMVIVKTYLHSIRSSDLVGWQTAKMLDFFFWA